MIARFAVFLFIQFISVVCIGQGFWPRIDNYTSKDYGRKHTPENWCTVQNTNGILFFGNGNGLLTFNGEDWGFIPVKAGSHVVSLAFDSVNNQILVGASGEFGYVTRDANDWTYHSLCNGLQPDEVSIVWKSYVVNGKHYFQSDSALFLVNDGKVDLIKPKTSFHTSFILEGQLYVRQRGLGLYKLNGNNLELVSAHPIFKEYGVFGMHTLQEDFALVVTQEKGCFKLNMRDGTLLPELQSAFIKDYGIVNSTSISDGRIALSTLHNGIVILDHDLNRIAEFGVMHGMLSNEVKHVWEDPNGLLWAGTKSGISSVYYGFPISTYDQSSGLNGAVEVSESTKDQVFAGTNQGLFYKENTMDGVFMAIDAIDFGSVWSLEKRNRHLYIGADKGLFRLELETFKVIQLTNQPTNAFAFDDANGVIVIGGPSGIYVLDSYSYEQIFEINQTIGRVSRVVIEYASNSASTSAWIGVPGYGLLRLEIVGDEITPKFYTKEDGLNTQWITPTIFQEKLVVASDKGLQHYVELSESNNESQGYFDEFRLGDTTFSVPFTDLTGASGFIYGCIDNRIHYLDDEQAIWVETPFLGIDADRVNSLSADTANLWISTSDGLISYSLPVSTLKHGKSLVRISSLEMGDSIHIYPSSAALIGSEYESNDVTIEFSSSYYPYPEKTSYSYRLIGYDSAWSEWTTSSEARYTNLPEGEYSIQVRSRNIYNRVSESAKLNVKIHPPWYRTGWAYFGYGILGLLILLSVAKLNALRLEEKNKKLQKIVDLRTKEISEQKDEIEIKKQEIMDSIVYAKRIQEAILPPARIVQEHFADKGFIYYQPKDIVAGDFYWIEPLKDRLLFAAADCTGHGVPGAMISVICSDALSRSVHEFGLKETSQILNKTRELVIDRFEKSEEDVKDGMDISLCSLIDSSLEFSGAHNPLWLIRKGSNQVEEYKADKQPIGNHPDPKPFNSTRLDLNNGDTFYIFSDGYADQFGGPKGKKLKTRPFKNFLLSIQQDSIVKQKQKIERFFEEWRGEVEQVDDVCLIGYRFAK